MAEYQQPKTDWQSGDIPGDDDFNRIEGNTQANREDIEDIESGATKIPNAENADNAKLVLGQTPLILNRDRLRSVKNHTISWDNSSVSQSMLDGVSSGFLIRVSAAFDAPAGSVEFKIGTPSDNVLIKTFSLTTQGSLSYNLMTDTNLILDTPFYTPIFASSARLEWENQVEVGSVTSKIITLD